MGGAVQIALPRRERERTFALGRRFYLGDPRIIFMRRHENDYAAALARSRRGRSQRDASGERLRRRLINFRSPTPTQKQCGERHDGSRGAITTVALRLLWLMLIMPVTCPATPEEQTAITDGLAITRKVGTLSRGQQRDAVLPVAPPSMIDGDSSVCALSDPCWPAFGTGSKERIAALKDDTGATLEGGSNDAMIVLKGGMMPSDNSGGLWSASWGQGERALDAACAAALGASCSVPAFVPLRVCKAPCPQIPTVKCTEQVSQKTSTQ